MASDWQPRHYMLSAIFMPTTHWMHSGWRKIHGNTNIFKTDFPKTADIPINVELDSETTSAYPTDNKLTHTLVQIHVVSEVQRIESWDHQEISKCRCLCVCFKAARETYLFFLYFIPIHLGISFPREQEIHFFCWFINWPFG